MRRVGRLEAAFATGLIGATLMAWHMTRYGAGFIHLLATGLLSFLITGPAFGARRSHARIAHGATR
jgi:hypothetical protein